jgi:integrase
MRQADLLGLTWDRVDHSRGVVLLEITKSGRRREVPLNARADAVLARRGRRRRGESSNSARWATYRTAWDRACEKAKLTYVRFHDTRHTFASWAIQRWVTLAEVRDLLGHHSLSMVQRYAHLSPDHLRAATAALDDVLPAAPASEPAPKKAHVTT